MLSGHVTLYFFSLFGCKINSRKNFDEKNWIGNQCIGMKQSTLTNEMTASPSFIDWKRMLVQAFNYLICNYFTAAAAYECRAAFKHSMLFPRCIVSFQMISLQLCTWSVVASTTASSTQCCCGCDFSLFYLLNKIRLSIAK